MNIEPMQNTNDLPHQVPTGRQTSAAQKMRLLPLSFQPSSTDVVCGRGKSCYAHVGNVHFKTRVRGVLELYRSARTKLDKSKVLNMVVEQVRQNSPEGGFVKQDQSGRWHEVGDFLAREKTSQAFRDALHDSYKSSNVSKKKRRQEELTKATDKLKVPRSSMDIARKIETMSLQMKHSPKNASSRPYDPEADIMAGIHHASRTMRHDSYHVQHNMHPQHLPPGSLYAGARITSVNEHAPMRNFEFEFEPDEYGSGPHVEGRSASFTMRPRYDSMAYPARSNSEPNVPQISFDNSFDFGEEPYSHESDEVHHSLPNIQFEHEVDDMTMRDSERSERMHRSAPTLSYYSPSDLMNTSERSMLSRVPEVPSTVEFQNRESAERPIPTITTAGIVSSLEQFADMELDDDNPFEPIPLEQVAET